MMKTILKNKIYIIVITAILIVAISVIFMIGLRNKSSWKIFTYYEETQEQVNEYKLYEFGSTECKECYEMKNIVENIFEIYSSFVDYEYIDVVTRPNITNKYRINTIPTFIIVDKSSKVLYRKSGIMSEDEISNFIKQVLNR